LQPDRKEASTIPADVGTIFLAAFHDAGLLVGWCRAVKKWAIAASNLLGFEAPAALVRSRHQDIGSET
jgi:hypothetical protein